MRIEIDQSGKIEQTDMDTVVAFSNNHQYAVLLPKQLKKKLIREYRKERQIILKLFVACVYYAIKDYLDEISIIVIDNEYEGKQNYIKSLLLDFIRKQYKDFNKKLIKISNITKRSKAHEVASNVKRGFARPQKTLSEKDIEKLIQGALKSKPASTTLSAKLRHGLAWHPSSTWYYMYNCYINFSLKNTSVGTNTTSPTKALHSIGEFNLSAAGTQREVSVNATCVIIKGQTSTLEVC